MSNYLINTQMSDQELEMQEDDTIAQTQEVVEDTEEELEEAKKSTAEMKADDGTSTDTCAQKCQKQKSV